MLTDLLVLNISWLNCLITCVSCGR